jgi:hypothetical protein
MKKLLSLIIVTTLINVSYSQWVTRTVDNGLDDTYKIAYCPDANKSSLLKMEMVNDNIVLYVTGSYFCDDNPLIEIAMKVGASNVRYSFTGTKSRDSKTIFFINRMISYETEDFIKNFELAERLVMRVNESHCEDEMYIFDMTNSRLALKFMSSDFK